MARELTEHFVGSEELVYPVRVVHQELSVENVEEDTIIFILNPREMKQSSFVHLIKPGVCYIFLKDPSKMDEKAQENALKLLLGSSETNTHLRRIKGLNRNVMEMHIVKNRRWDIFGLSMSYKQLFSIQGTGYCFVEYPVITQELLNLDQIFIQEVTRASHPMELITKYLDFMENNHCTKLQATNRRNAFQRVFPFYKSESQEYAFLLKDEDVLFLPEIIEIEQFLQDPINQAMMMGALSAACAYLVHMGYSKPYCLVIDQLIDFSKGTVRYKYIDDKCLQQLKERDAILYYQLACRIPNQYLVALYDLYEVEKDRELRETYSKKIDILCEYHEKRVSELILTSEGFLWGFKRDQEIGAIAGTLGQIWLYKHAEVDNSEESFKKAEGYFKQSIEYAYPAERLRDINYLIHCRLARLILSDPKDDMEEVDKKISELANLNRSRYGELNEYNPFDVMVSAEILAAASALLPWNRVLELYDIMDIDWSATVKVQQMNSHVYASYLLTTYLFFADRGFLHEKMDFSMIINASRENFDLLPAASTKKAEGIMELIAVKFIMGHVYYLSSNKEEYNSGLIDFYMEKINGADVWINKKEDYLGFLRKCRNGEGDKLCALKLIYTIPY